MGAKGKGKEVSIVSVATDMKVGILQVDDGEPVSPLQKGEGQFQGDHTELDGHDVAVDVMEVTPSSELQSTGRRNCDSFGMEDLVLQQTFLGGRGTLGGGYGRRECT